MAAIARTETLAQRTAILHRLLLRNRLVGILRYGVPAIGLIVFAALAIQITIGKFLDEYGITRISIDRKNLIVETPSYTAAGPDGTLYTMSAATARASFDQPDMLMLTDIALDLTPPGKTGTYSARVSEATLSAATQLLTMPGITTIAGQDGLSGSISDLVTDLGNRTMSGNKTEVKFSDGSSFSAESASFTAKSHLWIFTGVTMRVAGTPGETP